jgi:hypothetical protein
MITNVRRQQQQEEDSLYFQDRCREIHLMMQDIFVYSRHLKGDKTLLRKFKILNYTLAEFEDFCNRAMLSNNNNNNK